MGRHAHMAHEPAQRYTAKDWGFWVWVVVLTIAFPPLGLFFLWAGLTGK